MVDPKNNMMRGVVVHTCHDHCSMIFFYLEMVKLYLEKKVKTYISNTKEAQDAPSLAKISAIFLHSRLTCEKEKPIVKE